MILTLLSILGLFLADPAHAAVLVRVNGEEISDEDLSRSLANFTEAQRYNILKDRASKRQVLESLVDQELLYQQAKKEGMEKTPAYQQALKAFQKQYLAQALVSKNIGPKLSEAAIRQYYERNKHRFTTTQIHLMQILVETEAEAKEVLAKVKATGADFQAIAEKVSKDPTAKNNRGDLGFITRDQLPADLGDVVYRAKKGEILGPLQTPLGFHIVKMVDRLVGKQLSFDEVQLQSQGALNQELLQDFVKKSRIGAKIVFLEK